MYVIEITSKQYSWFTSCFLIKTKHGHYNAITRQLAKNHPDLIQFHDINVANSVVNELMSKFPHDYLIVVPACSLD